MERPGPSHVFTGEVSLPSTGSFSLNDPQDFERFKMQTQYQIMHQQRSLQEIRAEFATEKAKSEHRSETLSNLTDSSKRNETKLTSLQKIVGGQVDSNKKLEKEATDKYNEGKSQLEALTLEIATLKNSLERCLVQIDEVRRGVGGSVSIPANITQMFEALERQLGMYDVKLAENDVKFQVLETTNYDGKLLWKIKDFSRRRDDARRGGTLSIYSQPFYTSKYGYKMCLRIYLNGDGMGKNTHISLFFVLMKGDYDAMLPFPFRQKVTLMLLDQGPDRRHLSDVFRPDPSSSSFKRPSSDMNIASGCPMFVSHDVINNSTYLIDDTVFIRVIVDTTDLENF